MDRFEIINMLNRLQIQHGVIEHPPAETIEEIDRFGLPNAEAIVKNLFLRDDKKRNYYLVVVRKDKTVNLKELRSLLGAAPLSFASENDLSRYLGLTKGSVTPFGILNDTERKVRVVIDEDVMKLPLIGIHPNENTATVWLSLQDLRRVIEEHGTPVTLLQFAP